MANGTINQTNFTDYSDIRATGSTKIKAVHINEMQDALAKLETYVKGVDNCGYTNCCQSCQNACTCQGCQGCQGCQSCQNSCTCQSCQHRR